MTSYPMKLNASFISNIQSAYGQDGKTWLDNLPVHLNLLSEKWNFQLIHPVEDLSYHFVAIVKLPSGLAILKTAPPTAKIIAEAEWLKAHKKSVPNIFHIDKENNAFLMEKIEPGTSLKYLVKEGNDEKATRIISQVILDLQSSDTLHQMNYQHISEHIASFAFLRGHVDKNIIDRAETIFKNLCTDRSNDIILHGDLHHDNILQNDNAWSVIDPHGYIGDPCAEIGPMIFNPLNFFPNHLSLKNILDIRLRVLAEMLPFDLERIQAWAFCLALRSAAWDVEGFNRPNDHTIEIAKILDQKL
jgi:streptomycin 6-kinase